LDVTISMDLDVNILMKVFNPNIDTDPQTKHLLKDLDAIIPMDLDQLIMK